MKSFSQQLSSSFANLSDKLGDWLNTLILQLPNIVIAIIIAAIAFFLSSYIKKITFKISSRFVDNKAVQNLIANLSAVFFSVFAFFIILGVLNLDEAINQILATAGVLGLAVGLALQDPMNNLFSGIFMSVKDLYKIGDLVETNGHFGVIKQIDLRNTKIRLPNGQEVVIPNKDVIQNPIINYNSYPRRRVDIECGISYGDDLDKVESIVIGALKEIPNRINDLPVEIIFTSFGDSAINFIARYWITPDAQSDYLNEKSRGIKLIKKVFDKNNIDIPFPIRTLNFEVKGGIGLKEIIKNTPLSINKKPANAPANGFASIK
jgi:small conductance mechanosensitive channel